MGGHGKRSSTRWWIGGASAVCGVLASAALLFLGRGDPSAPGRQVSRMAPISAGPASTAARPGPIDVEAGIRAHFRLDVHHGLVYDPVAYVLEKPDSSSTWKWEEHRGGELTKRTNNLGFNEDQPTEIRKHGLRILVAGDSHTEGVVNNSESFCNVAERLLQQSLGRKDVEVLNAGVGYTCPTC